MTNTKRPLTTLEPDNVSLVDGTNALQQGQAPGIEMTLPDATSSHGVGNPNAILARTSTIPLFGAGAGLSLVPGNAGLPIMIFRRKSASLNNDAIRASTWQVVKIVQGTWLTAIAKYAPTLLWSDNELNRVYYHQWVDRCRLVGGNETQGPYIADNVAEGGQWQGGISQATGPIGSPRDVSLNPGEYWWFKLGEDVKIDRPKIAATLAPTQRNMLLYGARVDPAVLERYYRSLETLLDHPFKLERDEARVRLKTKVGAIKVLLKSTYAKSMNSTQRIEVLRKVIQQKQALLSSQQGNAEALAVIVSFAESLVKHAEKTQELAEDLQRVLETELDLIEFIFETYEIHHGQVFEVVKVQKGTDEERKWNKNIPPVRITIPQQKW